MVVNKGGQEKLVFGFGDVIIASRNSGGIGQVGFFQSEEGSIGRIVETDVTKKEPLALFEFRKIESLDVVIGDLKKLRKEMKKAMKAFTYTINWEKLE